VLVPAGATPLYTTTSPDLVAWDLAAIEAVKHAIASGNQFDSISITRNYVGIPSAGTPDIILAAPLYRPPPQSGSVMSLDDLRNKIQANLPVWASQARIDVAEDAAGERVVTVHLSMLADSFKTIDIGEVLRDLSAQQIALAPQGADIGRVLVRVDDLNTGAPLYEGGADGFASYWSDWYNPIVQAYAGELPPVAEGIKEAADAAQAIVAGG
jgi:hypothetical protein